MDILFKFSLSAAAEYVYSLYSNGSDGWSIYDNTVVMEISDPSEFNQEIINIISKIITEKAELYGSEVEITTRKYT